MEPFKVPEGLFNVGIVAFKQHGAELGRGAIYWTQSFFLQLLGIKDGVGYRKQQRKRRYIPTIEREWDLDGYNEVEAQPYGPRVSGQLSLRTDAILPWLLRLHSPPAAHYHTFAKSARLIHAWLDKGMEGLRDVSRLGFTVNVGDSLGYTFRVLDNGGLEVGDDFVDAYPQLLQLWARVQDVQQVKIRPIYQASLGDWVVFLWAVGTWLRAAHEPVHWHWVKPLRNSLAAIVAYGVDNWTLMEHMSVGLSQSTRLLEVRTKRGRKRKVPFMLQNALSRMRNMHGSSTSALSARCDDPAIDNVITHITVALYAEKTRAEFAGVNRLQINWDPATYSGYQVNLGVCINVDTDVACTLRPKAFG